MFKRLFSAAVLSSIGLQAIAFDFDLDGSLIDTGYACPQGCSSPWVGSLHLETDSLADGTYTGPDLLSFEFASNVVTYPDHFQFSGPPAVTLLNGEVVDIAVSNFGGISSWTFSIDQMTASIRYNPWHSTDRMASGTGTLTVAPIPEPATIALMLVGLAAIVVAGRLSRVGFPRHVIDAPDGTPGFTGTGST